MTAGTVLFVDDEPDIRNAVAQGLDLHGLAVECLDAAEPALDRVSRGFDGIVVSDIRMPGMDGMAMMRAALEIDPELPVVLVTGHGDVPLAVEAMRAGAYDFIEKPFAMAHLAGVAWRALDKRRLVLENRDLRSALADRSGLEAVLVGRSERMRRLRADVAAVAATDADVLIVGETGTGKEVVARALHRFGDRAGGPFVAINCGALPAEIIESELFGHERGAFTGALARRVGKLEHARGGIVFLDEIESMPLELQVKLLRVIETRSLERLGSNQTLPLDIRFLAATKRDLKQAGDAGAFRADLYYRLNVVTLQVPALCAHREDIPDLADHLAREAAVRYRRPAPALSAAVLQELAARDWPGNVRELRNVIDRMTLGIGDAGVALDAAPMALADHVEACERRVIAAELARHNGRINETHAALGLSRKTLYDKMVRYGLNREDFVRGGGDG
ncbi:MAG: sigma-54 dependent transcriptional regulator [Alphaproteobacteria bacterium]